MRLSTCEFLFLYSTVRNWFSLFIFFTGLFFKWKSMYILVVLWFQLPPLMTRDDNGSYIVLDSWRRWSFDQLQRYWFATRSVGLTMRWQDSKGGLHHLLYQEWGSSKSNGGEVLCCCNRKEVAWESNGEWVVGWGSSGSNDSPKISYTII